MWDEILGAPTNVQGQPHAESSWVLRIIPKGINPQDGKTHTHWYNTQSQIKMGNDKQGGDPKKRSSGGALKQMERNAGGLSLMPAELHKRQLDDPDIGPIL